ncbi:hypothetical protein HMI55_001040 [Coelomomyces lativittatus]|nr:hypothetical protein HMI55_001040 [Coelomomyces lativittatus]
MKFLLSSLICFYFFEMVLNQTFQVHFENKYSFNPPAESIRGFKFIQYFDMIINPNLSINITKINKIGKLELQGISGTKWVFCLEKNEHLFSPNYKFFNHDTMHPPQMHPPRSKAIQNCHYHGKVHGVDNGFVALSTCDGLNGMAIFNKFAKLSFHTLKNGSVIFVVENDYSTGMWTLLTENKIDQNLNSNPLLNVDIPAPDKNQACSIWENAKLSFDRKYYDITFALGYMEYGFNPDYAEHYIADTGNMLQLFFKYGNLKNFNFRLLATYYVSSTNILTTTNLNYAEVYFNPTKDEKITNVAFKKSFNFADKIFKLWASQNRHPPFLFENIVHPRVYMKHTFHSSLQLTINGMADIPTSSMKLIHENSAIVLVPHIRVLDYYWNVINIAHEVMHVFGLHHDENDLSCNSSAGLMSKISYSQWRKFSSCSLLNLRWDKFFQNEILPEFSNFFFEGDQTE